MTDQQVENWRKVLSMQFGPYAMMMPKEQIIAIRDRMQAQANRIDAEMKEQQEKKEEKKQKKEHSQPPKEKFDPENNWFQKALRRKH